MNWIKVAAWVYGGYFSLRERFEFPVKEIWSGLFLFAALTVLAGVIIAQFIK